MLTTTAPPFQEQPANINIKIDFAELCQDLVPNSSFGVWDLFIMRCSFKNRIYLKVKSKDSKEPINIGLLGTSAQTYTSWLKNLRV